MKELLLYLVAINVVGFFIMGFDKSQARNKRRRVPEKRLFIIAALGGAGGSWSGMRVFRHKTMHKSFKYGMPALLLVNVAFISYFAIVIGR
jgi:uncharacterized membrane protein YsdA (DUF1294 family)